MSSAETGVGTGAGAVGGGSSSSSSGSVAAVRDDVVNSAVTFLLDPKVSTATLAKKVAFLESKGLTTAEIEAAMARSRQGPSAAITTTTTTATAPAAPATAPQHQQHQHYPMTMVHAQPQPPPRPQMSWKDYFVAAVVIGGLGYGFYALFQQYMLPIFQSSATADETVVAEQQRIEEQHNETLKALNAVQDATADAMRAGEAQSVRLQSSLDRLARVLDKLSDKEKAREDELNRVRQDLDAVNTGLPDMIEKSKDIQKEALSELQNEIRSLKGMMLNRRTATTTTTSAAASTATSAGDYAATVATGSPVTPATAIAPAPTVTVATAINSAVSTVATNAADLSLPNLVGEPESIHSATETPLPSASVSPPAAVSRPIPPAVAGFSTKIPAWQLNRRKPQVDSSVTTTNTTTAANGGSGQSTAEASPSVASVTSLD